ncbi:abortive infection family protein [Paenibacillus caseinilyticus]|uniref:abortive infection family protein n=1 Tax=Paenibacillus caseinilyticus TaxID=3098138 RepID=UPI0022B89F90|nr:abortive infection family protein [Paenibacillus caseinilyticus]MCZ8518903.1 abortive infection family protein [Paenibacillus caseinilyticus]
MYEAELIEAEKLKLNITSRVTGAEASASNIEYKTIREKLIKNPRLKDKLPRYIHTCRTLDEIWGYFKPLAGTYQQRRTIIQDSFQPLLSFIEQNSNTPLDEIISDGLTQNNAHQFIRENWDKALERREEDPEGAITIARTLLEQTLKFILDQEGVIYTDKEDLPALYKKTQTVLNLSPDGHTEQIFKQILGGCASVVQGLGSLRNKFGDAHGHGIKYYKPSKRHAQLAVNIAGSLADFLISTWIEKLNAVHTK